MTDRNYVRNVLDPNAIIFDRAQDAFEYYNGKINSQGIEVAGTKMLRNVGHYILNPLENTIDTPWRKWSFNYAIREWKWYLSKDRSVAQIKKFAPIWDRMHGGDNIVNSNYGHLWSENDQLDKTIEELRTNPTSRRAWVSLFDGKNKDQYDKDTPCTMALGFFIENGKLCMDALMRSNDLWYGYCNDQFCFTNLQRYVANDLGLPVGWYYHFAADLHLYEEQWNKKIF